jgi:hypothetical protein
MAGKRPSPERPGELDFLADKQHHSQFARECESVCDCTSRAGHTTAETRDDRLDSEAGQRALPLARTARPRPKGAKPQTGLCSSTPSGDVHARQVTAASLQEIGRQFGGMHHTTVLHSINKIDAMRRTDEALNRTITLLMGRHQSIQPV